MFLGSITTLLQRIQSDEVFKYFDNLHGETIEIDTSDHQNKINRGNVLFKVSTESPYINSLMYHQGMVTTGNNCQLIYVNDLFNNVTYQLLQVSGTYNIADSLKIISNFIEKAGNNFYGALLKCGDTLINPLHPLVAPLLLANFEDYNSTNWNIILYFYNNRKDMDAQFKSRNANKENIKTQIDCLYNSVTHVSEKTVHANTISRVIHQKDDSCIIGVEERLTVAQYLSKIQNNIEGNTPMLVAHQMMTDGITAPYYGTTLLNYAPGNRSLGGHVSPFRSCNISYEGDSDRAFKTSELRYLKVCTGHKQSGTIDGLQTLTHANLGSPYTRYTIAEGALIYADECINKAMQIFKLAGILETEVTVTEVEQQSTVSKDLLDRYLHDRINLLKELHEKCSKTEFLDILKAIKQELDKQTSLGE